MDTASSPARPLGTLYGTPQRPAASANSPRISPSKPVPSYPKVQASTAEIAQPLSRLSAASQPSEVLQAVLDSLSKLVPFIGNVAVAMNLQSESLATHHDGIVRSMQTARQAETEGAALRRGIEEMKAELKANDDVLKSAVARLAAQDSLLAATAQSLGQDHAFVKNVIEQVTTATTLHVEQGARELEKRVSELDKQVLQLPPVLGDHLHRLDALEQATRRVVPGFGGPRGAAPAAAAHAEGLPRVAGASASEPRLPTAWTSAAVHAEGLPGVFGASASDSRLPTAWTGIGGTTERAFTPGGGATSEVPPRPSEPALSAPHVFVGSPVGQGVGRPDHTPGSAPFVQSPSPGVNHGPPGIQQAHSGAADPWQAYLNQARGGSSEPQPAGGLPQFMTTHLLTPPDMKDKRKFNEKVASMTGRQFDGVNDGGAWRIWCRNYLVSQAREMDVLLKIAESSEDREITTHAIQTDTASWIHPERVHALSFELWGFLNSNLTGKAKQKFDNI